MTLPADKGNPDRFRPFGANRRQFLAASATTALAAAGLAASRTVAQQGHSPGAATPSGTDEPIPAGDFPLDTLLAMLPLALVESSDNRHYWLYCDFARQFASLGLDQQSMVDDLENHPIIAYIDSLAPGSEAYSYAGEEDLVAAIGFEPLSMGQNLVVGRPPEQVTMFRGAFDPEALVAAWEVSGYEPASTSSGIPAWTIGPDGEFDVMHPVQKFVFAAQNNAAIHNDVIIFSQTLAMLNQVLDHLDGGGESALDDPLMGPVIDSLPYTTVSAMAMPPITDFSGLRLEPAQLEALQADLDAVREEAGPMPAMNALITAVDEGAMIPENREEFLATPVDGGFQDSGTMMVRLGMETAGDAEQAARVIVARSESLRSFMTGNPYSEYIEPKDSGAEGTTAMVDFTQLASPRFWFDMLARNDILLFVPDSGLE